MMVWTALQVFLSKIKLAEMLEASEYDLIDRVFLLLGAISGTFCRDFQNATVQKVLTDYVDFVQFVHRYNL